MKFELLIEADDNDCMRSRIDVAFALDAIARKLRHNTDVREGPVHDLAGTQVGFWTLDGDESSGVFTPVTEQVNNLVTSLSKDKK
jgi:hypothetical protein